VAPMWPWMQQANRSGARRVEGKKENNGSSPLLLPCLKVAVKVSSG
jgi:hypothetical protein